MNRYPQIWFMVMLCLLMVPRVSGAEGSPVMADVTEALGLKGYIGPTYTAGWLDLDMDGHDEPFWVSANDMMFVNQRDDGALEVVPVVVEDEPKPIYSANEWQQNAIAIGDFDRDGLKDVIVFGEQIYGFTLIAPATLRRRAFHFPPLTHTADTIEASVGDINGDGWPDIVLSRGRNAAEHLFPTGAPSLILINHGGWFTRFIHPSLPAITNGLTLADMDRDGRLDIVESKDFSRSAGLSQIFLNRTEPGSRTPVFVVAEHTFDKGSGGMGAAIADVNQDGVLDIYNTSGGRDNMAIGALDGTFEDETVSRGILHELGLHGGRVQWSPTLVDFNADGRLDLFVRHGPVSSAGYGGTGISAMPEANLLYLQEADGRFSRQWVPFDNDASHAGYNAVVGDVNGDGLPDVAMGNLNYDVVDLHLQGFPELWVNQMTPPAANRRLTVRLETTISADPATGAVVTAICGDESRVRYLTSGGKMGGAHGSTFYFGWPDCLESVSVEVQWPSGLRESTLVDSGQTSVTVVETPWWAWKQTVGESQIEFDNTTGTKATCMSLDGGTSWSCCDPGASCAYARGPAQVPALVRWGDSAPQALPSYETDLAYRTDPHLPAAGSTFLVEANLPPYWAEHAEAPWLRVDGAKTPWSLESNDGPNYVAETMMPFVGGEATLAFFVGQSKVLQRTVPGGARIDPRYIDLRLFPYEDVHQDRPWTLILMLRPDDASVKPTGLEVRLSNGQLLEPDWAKESTGRWFLELPFATLPPGAQVSIFDEGVLRMGPFPVYHAAQVTPSRVASVRGMVMRHALISDGDPTAVFFTLVDKDGHGLPPDPALVQLELLGLTQEEPLTSVSTLAWDLMTFFRSTSGVGDTYIRVNSADGIPVGMFQLWRRPSMLLPPDFSASSLHLGHSQLPAGVGAVTTLRIDIRGAFNERLGMEVEVTVNSDPALSLGPPLLDPSGQFLVEVQAGYFGGVFPIGVSVNGQYFDSVQLEVIGPALPEKGPVTATRSDQDAHGSDGDTGDLIVAETPGDGGCGLGHGPVPWFPLLWVVVCWCIRLRVLRCFGEPTTPWAER